MNECTSQEEEDLRIRFTVGDLVFRFEVAMLWRRQREGKEGRMTMFRVSVNREMGESVIQGNMDDWMFGVGALSIIDKPHVAGGAKSIT